MRRIVLIAVLGAATVGGGLAALPANASPACVSAAGSGVFNPTVGPACVPTPLGTNTETVNGGLAPTEVVTVTVTYPA